MKPALLSGAALLAAGLVVGTGRSASAQADRTLGINCTVAGHQHCGEDGPIFGSRRWYGWRHHDWRHHRRY